MRGAASAYLSRVVAVCAGERVLLRQKIKVSRATDQYGKITLLIYCRTLDSKSVAIGSRQRSKLMISRWIFVYTCSGLQQTFKATST